MKRRTVDLATHINQDVEAGHSADFPVCLTPLFRQEGDAYQSVPSRQAVVREDTGTVLSVVSDRYCLVHHSRILDIVQEAIEPLEVGPVPRGVYVDRQGARMRALYKFPALARSVRGNDEICPCLKIQNTYDGTSRIAIHIGAFRFVCTNLAVGGGGIFAGGFMSVHTGEIPLEEVAKQLSSYLSDFETIVDLYRFWADLPVDPETQHELLGVLPLRPAKAIREEIAQLEGPTVYSAYNAGTHYATHQMRSYRTAFDLLMRINRSFQEHYPLPQS